MKKYLVTATFEVEADNEFAAETLIFESARHGLKMARDVSSHKADGELKKVRTRETFND